MKTIRDHMIDNLLGEKPILDFEEVKKSQWSDQFITYMRNRMIVGAYRYGMIRDENQPKYDNIGSLIERAALYLESGNQEHLVDIANLALVEYISGCCHLAPHFFSTDDGYHTKEMK